MIFHIATKAAWAEAQAGGHYRAPSLDDEGFIHCSTREQVLGVANEIYSGQTDLLLLCIHEGRLRAELRWEAAAHPKASMAEQTADGSLFPHLYGVLNLDAVVDVRALAEGATGFALPPDRP